MDLPQAKLDLILRRILFSLCLIGLVLCLVFGYLLGFDDQLKRWQGYYTLAISSEVPVSEIHERLEQVGLKNSITRNNVTIPLTAYEGLQRRKLSSFPWQTLDDPRKTSWIEGLPQLFQDQDGNWELIYLRADESISSIMVKLQSAFDSMPVPASGRKWTLLEWRPIERIIVVIVCLLVVISLVWASPGKRLLLGFSALLWLPFAQATGPVLFPLQTAVFFLYATILESLVPALRRFVHETSKAAFFWDSLSNKPAVLNSLRNLMVYIDKKLILVRLFLFAFSISVFLACAIALGASGLVAGQVLVVFFSWPALLIVYARVLQQRQRRAEHRLFTPIPIISRSNVLYSRLRVMIPFIFTILLAQGLYFLVFPGSSFEGKVPALEENGDSITWQNIQAQLKDGVLPNSSQSHMPDLADFLLHAAWQEVFPFKRNMDYRAFAQLSLPASYGVRQVQQGTATNAFDPSTQIKLDQDWLNKTMAQIPRDSIESLIATNAKLSRLVSVSVGKVYSSLAWTLVSNGLLAALFLAIWCFGKNASIQQIYGTRPKRVSLIGRKMAA